MHNRVNGSSMSCPLAIRALFSMCYQIVRTCFLTKASPALATRIYKRHGAQAINIVSRIRAGGYNLHNFNCCDAVFNVIRPYDNGNDRTLPRAFGSLGAAVMVFGVEPEMASDAAESFRAGRIISYTGAETSRTLADGLRTQSVGALNFAHIQAFVDGIVTVSEADIRAAMRRLMFSAKLVVEPSGAVAAAAAFYCAHKLPAFRNAVVVLSGGNVEPEILRQVLD